MALVMTSATGVAMAEPPPDSAPLPAPAASDPVLGQYAAPSAPGAATPVAPNLNPWNNQYLLPQNESPAAPGQGQIFGVPPGQENADVSGFDYLKRLVDMYRAGGLEGGLLGQNPVEGLGKPLPVPSPQP
jgi:hypothetical protein